MMSELEKLEANLGGVADMKRQPDAVFVIDLKKEQLGVREARRLGVPVVGLVDTNADPDEADFVIPGNDDAIRSCSLITRVVADGIAAGQAKVTTAEFERRQPEPAEPTSEDAPAAAVEETQPEGEAEPETVPVVVAEAEPEPAAAAVAEGGDTP